ncbi:hypothetical protein [Cesiribacter andamanensis]|uniref:Uncharacterized protein n=1 Tax=Cesiribacter andamanensis AMV16 TaxID=1279009 RepID=M7P2H7_9BACT|nr:hypothetical protein [Cesiribacter andamanensis]EMR04749.1 hypothetical protein ADICEAN_00020 [Cesiribacter andamanensis AMV16]
MEEEPLGQALRTYITTKIRELGEWVKPDPADSLLLQVLKLMYKSVVVLLLTALSPVVLLFLIISFVGGF